MNYFIIPIRTVETPGEGSLSFFEGERDCPFEIKRIYYIHDTQEGILRGGHAHKHLQQLLFCPYGKILIKLNDGTTTEEILLDSPEKGLVIQTPLWREMLWLQNNSVLCVAANAYYDETDYIRDYPSFLAYLEERALL